MVDILYNFIRNDLMGQTTITGADNLALLLTWTVIICVFMLFIRLAMWAFYLLFNRRKLRR